MRSIAEILALFHKASLAARDAEFYLRCRERKPYLSREIIERWEIGCAPTLTQCKRAWSEAARALGAFPYQGEDDHCERELRSVGLLIDPIEDGPGRQPYMFFRDCMVFPYFEASKGVRVGPVYFSSRRLRDFGADGEPLDKSKKALCMRAPDSAGKGGLPRPAGFNLLALDDDELLECAAVEGCLDAIACTENGHITVGQVGSEISEKLGAQLCHWQSAIAGRVLYSLPDGTKDVTPFKRLKAAYHAGPRILLGVLPAETDPDELDAGQLNEIKAAARPLWEETLDLHWRALDLHIHGKLTDACPELGFARNDDRKDLWKWLCAWSKAEPTLGETIWAAYLDRAGFLTSDEKQHFRTELGLDAAAMAKPAELAGGFSADPYYPQQPAPPGKAPSGDEDGRPEISNSKLLKETDEEGTESKKIINLTIDQIRGQIQKALNGYPFRLGPAGQKQPVLFLPDNAGSVRPFHGARSFETVCMEYATLKFREKADSKGSTPVKWDNLFQHFAGSTEVQEYSAVAYRPHEPLIDGLFYAYRPDPDYQPDGRYLLEALELFDNIQHPWMQYIFVAMICTPYWGGPKAARPIGCYTADAPGRGKGKASELVGLPAGGMIEIEAGKRGEEQFKERLLSGDSFYKWVIRLDNLKRGLTSPVIESVVTLPDVSGKGMYKGESSRPNYFTMLVTANNPRVSSDIARRSVFIHLNRPIESLVWNKRYQELVSQPRRIVADAVWLLRQRRPCFEIEGTGETFGDWFDQVAGAVLSCDLFRNKIGMLDFKTLIHSNQERRQELDQDREYAQNYEQYLIRFIAGRRGLVKLIKEPHGNGWRDVRETHPPAAIEKIMANELELAWNLCFGSDHKKHVVGKFIMQHHNAGRFVHLRPAARASSGVNYELPGEAFTEFLKGFERGEENMPNVGFPDSRPMHQANAPERETDLNLGEDH